MGTYTFPQEIKKAQALLQDAPEQAAACLAGIDATRLTTEDSERMEAAILALPDELVAANCDLCLAMALLQLEKGNEAAAKAWQARLAAQRDGLREGGNPRRLLENRIFCANIAMPAGQNANILFRLAVLAHEYAESKLPLARLSATSKNPSVLRGAKDFSTLGKHYKASASMLRPLLPYVLHGGGEGVCEVAIAEILYEKGDINGAAMQAAAALAADDVETAFAVRALMARIAAVDTAGRPYAEVLEHIGAMLEKKDAPWLRPNYDALCARFHMLRGNNDKVRAWLEGCGLKDLDRIAFNEMYGMITKARAYIALGEYRSAATLLEALLLLNERYDRVLDRAECLVNSAIVCQALGNEDLALERLEQALLLTGEFLYVRVYADCGRPAFQLLSKYAKSEGRHENVSEKYLRRIIDAAGTFSALYPALYKAPGAANENGNGKGTKKGKTAQNGNGAELTNSELHVLQLMDSGKSNKFIAGELHVAPSTVKFHISNILQKLNAANRVEAIKNARDRGLLA